MLPTTRRRLIEPFEPGVTALKELLGRPMTQWHDSWPANLPIQRRRAARSNVFFSSASCPTQPTGPKARRTRLDFPDLMTGESTFHTFSQLI